MGTLIGGIQAYHHVERLGGDECEGLLDGHVFVEEKLDGANASVALLPDRGLVIATRNQTISVGGDPPTGFRGLVEYVLRHPGIGGFLQIHPDLVLRGEWMCPHTVLYDKAAYNHLYVFDIETQDGSFVPLGQYRQELEGLGIRTAPLIAELDSPTIEDLAELVNGPSALGGADREGIVVKRYGYVNKYGRTAWGKLVALEFKQKTALRFGPQRGQGYDEHFNEMRFADLVTEHAVRKTMDKIIDQKGRVSIGDMAQILGMCWHDLFHEELWGFVMKKKVKAFDFYVARKYAVEKVRDIALAHFNGLELPPRRGQGTEGVK